MPISADPSDGATVVGRLAVILFWVVLAAVGVMHFWSVFTQNVNWDEFALLNRAVGTLQSGEILGGGRPGLGTIILVPFANACENAVEAIVRARLLWFVMVVGAAVAFWFLLKTLLPPSRHRWTALALALSVWVLGPVFLRSATQVRTDQPAILFGLLGGLCLLNSRTRLSWALVAGLSLGIGFLASQKLVYVAALVGVLAAADLVLRRDWQWRREAWRGAIAAGAFLLVIVGYRIMVGSGAGAPQIVPGASQMDAFTFYRERVGWEEYRHLFPFLTPQLLPLLSVPLLTAAWLREPGRHGGEIVLAWIVLGLGVAVAIFHAGRFGYFLLTLGLFPAAAVGLVSAPLLDRIQRFDHRATFLVIVWLPLAASGLAGAAILTADTQEHQREALVFVSRNFPPDARGFDATAAFACRWDPEPFPVRFPRQVWAEFVENDADARGRALLEEFRTRPVSFMILPRFMAFYPEEVRDFWQTRYVEYYGPILVPGREIRGAEGWTGSFEVVVPGEYIWRSGGSDAGVLQVGAELVKPGETVVLTDREVWDLRLPEGGAGTLVLALRDPPSPGDVPFYVGS